MFSSKGLQIKCLFSVVVPQYNYIEVINLKMCFYIDLNYI